MSKSTSGKGNPSVGLKVGARDSTTRYLTLIPLQEVSLEGAAAFAGTSARTLRRRLREEGTSFQQLLNDERRSRVLLYGVFKEKQGGPLRAEDAYRQLGYSCASSLRKRFPDWYGMTWGQYVKTHQH